MPNKDGTGPNGQGSKTGRGVGRCGGKNISSGEQLLDTQEDCCDPDNATFGKRDGSGKGKGRGAGNNGAGRRCSKR